MSTPLILACLWVILATPAAFLPARINWPIAYGLIAFGLPLVGWVMWEDGVIIGLLVLAGGASILRWPVIYLTRWIKRKIGVKQP